MRKKVFKFGGASVKDSEQIKNVCEIMKSFQEEKTIVVISAKGKTTNALEKVVNEYFYKNGDAYSTLTKIKDDHYDLIKNLINDPASVLAEVNDLFVEIEWVLEEEITDSYDYVYDQIVSVGELVSTKIVNEYLNQEGLKSVWLDIRDVLKTDETYREACVKWELTQKAVLASSNRLFNNNNIIITQGFIGSTIDNNTTTLGREGSDYTAGILSFCIDADSMHIWKDVPGILTADPAEFNNVSLIERLSYKEAVEMTYYGAKVIHPKTIKPIQNKNIPLYVRPFRNPNSTGTLIADDTGISYPPVIVVEHNQSLLHISTNDFSFVAEHHLSKLFSLLAAHRLKVNMMRNTAISFTISVDSDKEKMQSFLSDLNEEFKVVIDNDLELITIRHYSSEILESMKLGKVVLMEEKLKETVRLVVRDIPQMVRKAN